MREMAFSDVNMGVLGPHWRLVSCSSNLSMSSPHSISSFEFTRACASSRSATVGFFWRGGASYKSEVVVGSVAHLARYHT